MKHALSFILSVFLLCSCSSRYAVIQKHDSLSQVTSSVSTSEWQQQSLFSEVTGSQFHFTITSLTYDPVHTDSLGNPSLVNVTVMSGYYSDSTNTNMADTVSTSSTEIVNDSISHNIDYSCEKQSNKQSGFNMIIMSIINISLILLIFACIYLYFRR